MAPPRRAQRRLRAPGAFTVEDRHSGERCIIRAGEAFTESIGVVHRGYTEDEGADIVVTCAGVAGVELSVPSG